jgi:hypothetical protein
MTVSKLTILVSGMIAAEPNQGGTTWVVLQYLLGLRRLGHRVWFVEPLKSASLRPAGASLAESANVAYFRQVMEDFRLAEAAGLFVEESREIFGLSWDEMTRRAAATDLLINLSGLLRDGELLHRIPQRVWLDLDPGFVQLWQTQGIDMGFDGHTHFGTVGTRIGTPQCDLPTCGRDWIPTLQPVVLDEWPVENGADGGAFTTIANWRGYGSVERNGVHYGQKAHSWRNLMGLPRLTSEELLTALAIHPGESKDLTALAANGWNLIDPASVAADPASYRQFIRESKGEFGVAKSGYVAGQSGWFSDRSACYLASGRPVLAQDTGFSAELPTGEGLLRFRTTEEAAEGLESISRDYVQHARAARRIAEEHFDSDVVLSRLLSRVGAA